MAWILAFEQHGLPDRNYPITRPETAERIIRIMGYDPKEPSLQYVGYLGEIRLATIAAIVGFEVDDPISTVVLFREV